jgi:hypothetical protein
MLIVFNRNGSLSIGATGVRFPPGTGHFHFAIVLRPMLETSTLVFVGYLGLFPEWQQL